MLVTEANLELVEAALRLIDSFDGKRGKVQRALWGEYKSESVWPYVVEMFDDKVVYEVMKDGKSVRFSRKYTLDGDTVKLGEARAVELAYIPAEEALRESEFSTETFEFSEALTAEGTGEICLIKPGQGSSAFYPEEVLKRDGPTVFKAGTHMYWNHQTRRQRTERPEGDLRDLAAVLVSDAEWKEGGEGKGLYAKFKATKRYVEDIKDLAQHIGVSIRAAGQSVTGQVAGKVTEIAKTFTKGISVDFVTRAGAGGKVVELFEAAGRRAEEVDEGGNDMALIQVEESEYNNLKAANATLGTRLTLIEAQLRNDRARSYVEAHLPSDLKPETKGKLAKTLASKVTFTEAGEVDEAASLALIEAEVKEERAYIARLFPTGAVTGNGEGTPAAKPMQEAGDPAKVVANLKTLRGL